jgi:murein DD-endopeptidase MepM/ murein hydrolase activator NlpD
MIDMSELSRQVHKAIDSVADIKKYLRTQRDAFYATPAGLPVIGPITSPFGPRPRESGPGASAFHHGLDIRAALGTPVHVTADGVVSFSGEMKGSGNIVVVEHGLGYSTAYAHGSVNLVKVGQRVKRGDVIVSSGSTGRATGPHVHYEVWKNGTQIDPLSVMTRR